jgi:putative transposase
MEKRSTGRAQSSSPEWESLEEWTRAQVQELIQAMLEEEITELLGRAKSERRRLVDGPVGYRNGYGKPRKLTMSAGTITLRRPRTRGLDERFESGILPLFKRRTKEVGELLPKLYLHGLSLGDFDLALRGLLGQGAALSASSMARLRVKWEDEYRSWKERSLESKEVVYIWADGIYVKAGLEKEKSALLVVIGALRDGSKEVLAVESGYRESTESWSAILRDLRDRGMSSPRLAIGDGHLGLWGALREIYPATDEGRCWNHKITNVLDQLPRKLRDQAAELLCRLPYAETEAECEKLRDKFAAMYKRAYPKAVETLLRDWERMVAFYRFPKEHWRHLRTTNIVESPFAAVRLRTSAAKRFKKVANATALIWKVLMVAESRFRKLQAPELVAEVAEGAKYIDGIRITRGQRRVAA